MVGWGGWTRRSSRGMGGEYEVVLVSCGDALLALVLVACVGYGQVPYGARKGSTVGSCGVSRVRVDLGGWVFVEVALVVPPSIRLGSLRDRGLQRERGWRGVLTC